MRRTIIAFLALSLCASARVAAQTNSWVNSVSSQWRITNRWSLHVAPAAAQTVIITNTGTFTVTINDMSTPASLTVSSLAVSNPLGSTTLSLINAPGTPTPMVFTVTNSATIGMGAVLDVDDVSIGGTGVVMLVSNLVADGSVILQATSTLSASGASPTYNIHLGSTANSTGSVSILGGSLIGKIAIGEQGTGYLVISNGTVQSPEINVGASAGANGLWQIAGGVNTVTNLSLASSPGSVGTVVMTEGQLNLNTISFGQFGDSYFVANGIFQCPSIDVTALAGGQALWQIAGGTSTVNNVMLASLASSTGEVVMTGGLLNAGSINFGGGVGSSASLVMSNGMLNTGELDLVNEVGSSGTLTVAGGTVNLSADMYIGYFGTGTVWLTGGEIDVTNNAPNTGLIRLVGNGMIRPYLALLVCSGGVLRATEVDVGDPEEPTGGGLSSWTIAGGTNIVNNGVYIASPPGHPGLLTVNGGVLQTSILDVGSASGSEGSGGAVVISGGVVLPQMLTVGVAPGQTSQVSITGGSLTITNGAKVANIGGGGPGQIIVSSGTFNASTIYVGASPFSPSFGNQPGILSISGGTVKGNLLVGEDIIRGSTGTVWITGGSPPDNITIGDTGIGNMYVLSNVVFHPLGVVTVGNQNGSVGSLNLQGGTSFSSREIDYMAIGWGTGSTGTVWVTDGLFQAAVACGSTLVGVQGSGRFSATNSTLQLFSISIGSQGTVECVGSQLFVFGPCTTANNNFISLVNSTGEFGTSVNNVGTIVANNSTLTFFQPVNNSGCIVATNGSVQFSGGITNSGAVLLGPSQFCISSIVATGNDLLITWPAFGGNHYRVQAANNPADTYSDISTDIVASGTGLGTTNYVDAGGVTNNPSRFYKVRQTY